ncbi:hypothetical protein ACFL1X_00120 [Candidatus Hydrogenedentota bacterium]
MNHRTNGFVIAGFVSAMLLCLPLIGADCSGTGGGTSFLQGDWAMRLLGVDIAAASFNDPLPGFVTLTFTGQDPLPIWYTYTEATSNLTIGELPTWLTDIIEVPAELAAGLNGTVESTNADTFTVTVPGSIPVVYEFRRAEPAS